MVLIITQSLCFFFWRKYEKQCDRNVFDIHSTVRVKIDFSPFVYINISLKIANLNKIPTCHAGAIVIKIRWMIKIFVQNTFPAWK